MKRPRVLTFLTVVGACGLRASAEQAQIGAVRDNTLIQRDDGSLSNGAGPGVFAGRTREAAGLSIRRALIAFDVAGSVPPGSTIHRVTLTLRMDRAPNSTGRTVRLHRVQADWGEAGSYNFGGIGAGAEPGDATWLHTFYDDRFWSAAGGDFAATPSASAVIGGLGFYTWGSTPEMVADVQHWVDAPAEQFGWVLVGDESAPTTVKRFASREHEVPSQRPLLTVDFTPPAACEPCDLNCDGAVDAGDIQPFIGRLFDDADPCCGVRGERGHSGDANRDGSVDAGDIQAFIDCLFG